MSSNAFIIAGPNGAGKTTFARKFLPKYADFREFLNADLMAAGIAPFDPDRAAIAAGRVLLARLKELVREGVDFGFETTLSGTTYRTIFGDMKRRGYRLHLFYLWLPGADLAVERVTRRVENGGHDVPEPVIRRRFDIGTRNLIRYYMPLMDSWRIFDNSTIAPRLAVVCELGKLEVFDPRVYELVCSPRPNGGESQ
ncbi:MAG: zeta toxin family protein [Thermoguttaceae bacterium]